MLVPFHGSFAPGYDKAFADHAIKLQFEAVAACTKDGRPTYEQLRMNGMLPR